MNFKYKSKALFYATLIFILIFEIINYSKFVIKNIDLKKDEPISKTINYHNDINLLDQIESFTKCEELLIDSKIDSMECEEKFNTNSTDLKSKKTNNYIFLNNLFTNNYLIIIIYILLIITLSKQLLLYNLAKNNLALTENHFHHSEWNINAAPMLGLLGTFLSIALLLDSSVNKDISSILMQNFFDAVMTTIIGICFYLINLYLKIKICSKIK